MLCRAVHDRLETVNCLCFIPFQGKELLVSGAEDGTITLWDYNNSMNRVMTLSQHKQAVNDILFLPEFPDYLFAASDDRTISVWSLVVPSTPVGVLKGCGDAINKIIPLPCGACPEEENNSLLLVAGCDDGFVYILQLSSDFTQSSIVDRFLVSSSTVNDLIFYDGVLVTGSEDNAVRSWRLLFQPAAPTEQRLIESVDEFTSTINHLCLLPPGVLTPPPIPVTEEDNGSDGPSVPHSPVAKGRGVWLLVACAEIAFGTDFYGCSVCTGGIGGMFGKAVKPFQGHKDYIRGMHITKENTLYTVADDCTLIEWNLETGEMIRQVQLHDAIIMSSALSAAKDVLATGTIEGEIRLWKLPFQTERMVD